jgi:hypothetical protein
MEGREKGEEKRIHLANPRVPAASNTIILFS